MIWCGLLASLGLGLPQDSASDTTAVETDLDVLQVVLLEKGPAWTDAPSPELDALHAAHLAFFDTMWEAGQLEVCGPVEDPAGTVRGVCIYGADKASIARTWARQDPAVQAGHLTARVLSWQFAPLWITFPNSRMPAKEDGPLAFEDFGEDDFIASLSLDRGAGTPDCPAVGGAPEAERFDDVDRWAPVFDSPERDAWQQPAAVVELLGLGKGMAVADIGAGTGYFNAHLASAVGKKGRVIAVDVERSLVDHMAARAAREGTPQVMPRLARLDDAGLLPGEVDRVLMVNTYHHIADRPAYFAALRRALRPGGQLMVVDFKPGPLPVGPPPGDKLSPEQVAGELEAAGWRQLVRSDALEHQFVLVFEPVAAAEP